MSWSGCMPINYNCKLYCLNHDDLFNGEVCKIVFCNGFVSAHYVNLCWEHIFMKAAILMYVNLAKTNSMHSQHFLEARSRDCTVRKYYALVPVYVLHTVRHTIYLLSLCFFSFSTTLQFYIY